MNNTDDEVQMPNLMPEKLKAIHNSSESIDMPILSYHSVDDEPQHITVVESVNGTKLIQQFQIDKPMYTFNDDGILIVGIIKRISEYYIDFKCFIGTSKIKLHKHFQSVPKENANTIWTLELQQQYPLKYQQFTHWQ